jgi:hypothetical protein
LIDRADMEKEHGRTPLFGQQPAWWGQDEQSNKTTTDTADPYETAAHSSTNDTKPTTSFAQTTQLTEADTVSDTEAIRMRPPRSPPAGFGGRRSLKPVRMDFDFGGAPAAAAKSGECC